MTLSTIFTFVTVAPMMWVLYKEWRTLCLLFALCLPAYAQPIPRPAPLKSPRDASQPKAAPMLKVFTPAGGSSSEPSTVFVSYIYNINADHCDTNDPNCLLWDQTHVWAQQKAGYNMTIEYTHALGSGSWAWLSQTGAAPYDRKVDVYRLLRSWQRPQAEFFRTVSTLAPTGALAPASGRRINPEARGWFFK